MRHLEVFIDGASKGNPGSAGIGVVLFNEGQKCKELSMPIGEATNNIAEYSALLCGLREALHQKAEAVTVYTDSELVYRQLRGEYKVKEPALRLMFSQAQQLIGKFSDFKIVHILRQKNKEADRLASLAAGRANIKAGDSFLSFKKHLPQEQDLFL